jgi:hypothetical protein
MQDNSNVVDIFDSKYKFFEDKDYDMLDFLFQAFANSEDKEGLKKQYQVNDKNCDEQFGKLYDVLKYFAEKDGGQISEETKDMLKNNNAFINFVGWVLSSIQEYLPAFTQNFVKRCEFSTLKNETEVSF